VLKEDVDAGVIIHENRFTYRDNGLVKLLDLGEYWEQQTGAPIPLGGIIIKRTFDNEVQTKVQQLIRKSVEYSLKTYPEMSSYVSDNSQEMSKEVMCRHIDLYVNDFSINLKEVGKAAVVKLLDVYATMHETCHDLKDIFVADEAS
jgi:1,4-dihydroxy-6-naphthoate synthase